MYIVRCHYDEKRLGNSFETLEEAEKDATEKASSCLEGCMYSVSEVKKVLRAEPFNRPVQVVDVAKLSLENKSTIEIN